MGRNIVPVVMIAAGALYVVMEREVRGFHVDTMHAEYIDGSV